MARPTPEREIDRLIKICRTQDEGALLRFIRNASVPMWIFDQQTLRFLEVNQAAIDLYGYSETEFLSLTVLDIRPSEDVPEFLGSAVRGHHSSIVPELWRHRLKNNAIILVDIQSVETTFHGRNAEVVSAAFKAIETLRKNDGIAE